MTLTFNVRVFYRMTAALKRNFQKQPADYKKPTARRGFYIWITPIKDHKKERRVILLPRQI
jgi:hypothetical protein